MGATGGVRTPLRRVRWVEGLATAVRGTREATGVSNSDQEKQPATVEEAARLVLSWLEPEDRAQFVAAVEKDDLISLHFGLALAVRNRLGLWGSNEKLLMDCAQAR